MSFKHPTVRTLAAAAGLLSVVCLSQGCIFSPDSGKDTPHDTVVPVPDSVQHALDLYTYAWTNKDYDRYQQVLHDNFEYFPQTQDLVDLTWMIGDSWGRTEELQMARNMFNPSFEPADSTAGSIDTIAMELTVVGQQDDQQRGGVVVTTHAVMQVMYDTTSGARSDVYFDFLVVPNPHEAGRFQLREQKERATL